MRRLLPLVSLCLVGCGFLRAPIPMASKQMDAPGEPARCLVLLLPGAGDHPGDFAEEGFVSAIERSGVSVDIVAADATMGYYLKGITLDKETRRRLSLFPTLLGSINAQVNAQWPQFRDAPGAP